MTGTGDPKITVRFNADPMRKCKARHTACRMPADFTFFLTDSALSITERKVNAACVRHIGALLLGMRP